MSKEKFVTPVIEEEIPFVGDNSKIVWQNPTKENWSASEVLQWTSECQRYRVVYFLNSPIRMSKEEYGASWLRKSSVTGNCWDQVEDSKQGPGYPQYYRSLENALAAVELFHCERTNTKSLTSNKEDLISEHVKFLKAIQEKEKVMTATATETYEVNESAARTMLVNMGFEAAKECNTKKLLDKLKNIDKAGEVASVDPEGEDLVLFRAISKAIEDGKEVVLSGSVKTKEKKVATKVEKKGKASVNGKASANGKHEKADKKTKPEKMEKEKAGVDKFGSRLGSNNALINSLLTKKPQTMNELRDKAGLEDTFYDHLKKMAAKGYVQKVDKGFALV